MLRKAVKNNQAHRINLVFLTDRILVAEGKKQKFGTQFMLKNNKFIPFPIKDRKNINKIRLAYVLDTIEKREKEINKKMKIFREYKNK